MRGPSFGYLRVLRVVFRTVPRPLPSALLTALALALPAAGRVTARPPETLAMFHTAVRPILEKHCYDCHGNGISKGGVTLDAFASDAEVTARPELWHAVLRNVQAGLMPAHEEGVARPSPEELRTLAGWIKYGALGIDPADPDPGHVTVRRLNRAEYRNTIRDLLGHDFLSEVEFPPDDSGGGFDNNGEVLTVSPMLLEKYLSAAETIVEKAVPRVARVLRERTFSGREFRAPGGGGPSGDQLNARRAARVARSLTVDTADRYRIVFELETRGTFDFDPSRCRLIARVDGREVFAEEVAWSERRPLRRELELEWAGGRHEVSFEVVPLEPAAASPGASRPQGVPGATSVTLRVNTVTVQGPLDPRHWLPPENYARFFPEGPAPADPAARDRYAGRILGDFARRAFRRPVEPARVGQLVALARAVYGDPARTFEEGVGRAMMAVLASPRFLFRVEGAAGPATGRSVPVDDHALATRLSYFLWSSMPDAELFRLADAGTLRAALPGQLRRMLADPKAQAFARDFTGQWLQARDIETIPINARAVLGPDAPRNRDGRVEFDGAFRRLMRSETEAYFTHLLREDRDLVELVDSDYAFLNEKLATHYGVPGVTGDELRRVALPAGSPRGGVLTQGTVLTVTSNPTRTSPVKRGLFVLENILGTPPPPAPPDVPELEEARKQFAGRDPKLSEMLAAHRGNPLCHSCHSRMDPLGLAFENFNALGGWRDTEARQPIDSAGQLATGERFTDLADLKRVLARDRRADVYRCLAEKVFTYALGRAAVPGDAHTLDAITERLLARGGRATELLLGVVESPAFQRRRTPLPGAALTRADPIRE